MARKPKGEDIAGYGVFPVRPGYEKRYVVDPTQTLHFDHYVDAMNEKDKRLTLRLKAKDDVRIRVRLRSDGWDVQTKVPTEVKTREDQEAQTATVASHVS